MQYFQEIFPSSNPNIMQDTVKVVANQVQDQFKADYGLASVPVCRRVIIHTLGVQNEFVSTGIVPKLR
jgi:hypothetical protein